MPIRNPRWLPPQVIVLTQDHMGKYRNIFFSEAIALIEPKLCRNIFPIGSNVKLSPAVYAHLPFYIGTKNLNL
jgi:hypothetical protein